MAIGIEGQRQWDAAYLAYVNGRISKEEYLAVSDSIQSELQSSFAGEAKPPSLTSSTETAGKGGTYPDEPIDKPKTDALTLPTAGGQGGDAPPLVGPYDSALGFGASSGGGGGGSSSGGGGGGASGGGSGGGGAMTLPTGGGSSGGGAASGPRDAQGRLLSATGGNMATGFQDLTLANLQLDYIQRQGAAAAANAALQNSIQAGYGFLRNEASQTGEQLLGGYANIYGSALNFLGAGQNTAAGLMGSGYAGLAQAYPQLQQQVTGTIQGIGASRDQEIRDAYAAQVGASRQSLVSRGLGNTTVRDSVDRGLLLDQQKALTANANSVAGLTAGYQSQLGLAGLSSAERGTTNLAQQYNQMGTSAADLVGQHGFAGMNALDQTNRLRAQIGLQGLNQQNTVTIGYPDPAQYQMLAQQYGANQQARMWGW